MRVLIIDNYDSFTFNLYQCVGDILARQLRVRVTDSMLRVVRNNDVTLEDVRAYCPTHIIISPGPGSPVDPQYFGICKEVILTFGTNTPVLGVCLGMQGIAHAFGGEVVRARVPMHGKISCVSHDGLGVFEGLPQRLEVMRYHSLIVDPKTLPECLTISAWVWEGSGQRVQPVNQEITIMGIRHKELPVEGVQFHPESFATEGSSQIISNFLFAGGVQKSDESLEEAV